MVTRRPAPSATLIDHPTSTPAASVVGPAGASDTPTGSGSDRNATPLRDRVAARQSRRKAVRARRDAQAKAIYPFARTFRLTTADAVGPEAHAKDASARLPQTITLITPDHDEPTKDHLYVGAYPVLSRNLHYDPAFEELTFVTSDGSSPVRGHLRLTRSRTRAYGILEYAGHSFAVEYAVEPQRYRMKVGKGAAYLAGSSLAPAIKWDETSDRWKDAPWTEDCVVGFRYGVTGEEVIGDETLYDFVASFDDITSRKKWEPIAGDYLGLLDSEGVLKFALQAGANPPQRGTRGATSSPICSV